MIFEMSFQINIIIFYWIDIYSEFRLIQMVYCRGGSS